jgi:hypothetical protein
MVFPSSWLSLLVVVNLVLQVWDGYATYYGLSLGVTLVGAKSAVCVFVVSLSKVAYLSVSQWGLILTAVQEEGVVRSIAQAPSR